MKSEKLKLAVAQMTSTDRLDENFEKLVQLYLRAVKEGVDLIVFPENTLFFRIRSGSKLEAPSDKILNQIDELVQSNKTSLMLTTPLAEKSGKFRNSTLLFRPQQSHQVVYSKIHLFDVDVVGAPSVRESDYFERGDAPILLDVNGWKLGLSICYDLRFAELYLNYAQKADLILIPSAFLVPTGEAHWLTLVRARAIEAQAYVAAPAQSGEHKSGDQLRQTYGHSLVVDPWGRVMAELPHEEGLAIVELSKETILKVRRQIPMQGHRRL